MPATPIVKKFRFTLIFSLLLWIVTGSLAPIIAEEKSFIGIKRFSFNDSASAYYNSIDILLFQRLSFELLPRGIKPLLIEDSIPHNCIALAGGQIEITDGEPILIFSVTGTAHYEEEIKKISLSGQPVDAVVDLLAIKIRQFLEQTISGKLIITTTPRDCDILLNGVRIGKSPAELILGQGTYAIQLQRDYLYPFIDTVRVFPGKETNLTSNMVFKGHTVKPWCISAIVFTGGLLIAQALEYHYDQRYSRLKTPASKTEFNDNFYFYRTANTVKISLLVPMTLTWTIAGYHFFENRSLKQQIFTQK